MILGVMRARTDSTVRDTDDEQRHDEMVERLESPSIIKKSTVITQKRRVIQGKP